MRPVGPWPYLIGHTSSRIRSRCNPSSALPTRASAGPYDRDCAARGADDDPRVADFHAEPFIAERGLADDAVHFHEMALVLLDQCHDGLRARDAESAPRDVRAVDGAFVGRPRRGGENSTLETAARQHLDRVLGDGLGLRLLILGDGENRAERVASSTGARVRAGY